jgi:hypothetical protein
MKSALRAGFLAARIFRGFAENYCQHTQNLWKVNDENENPEALPVEPITR